MNRDTRATFGELLRDAAANAFRRARYQNDLACEVLLPLLLLLHTYEAFFIKSSQ